MKERSFMKTVAILPPSLSIRLVILDNYLDDIKLSTGFRNKQEEVRSVEFIEPRGTSMNSGV